MATSRSLLDRLLTTPGLALIVPGLHPEVLHRVIQTCGLEDCAEFVALATSEQLARVLDLDIWRVRTTGGDEAFDAGRFGLWLEVLMQSGAAVAAEKIAGLDMQLVIAGLAGHVRVFDHLAIASYTTLDGEHVPGGAVKEGPVAEIGGYVVEASRLTAWDAIVDLLAFLAAERREYFDRLMRGCVRLSDGSGETDGLHDLLENDEQHLFDLACAREARRERQGYVTRAQAHAFLRRGRHLQLDGDRPTRNPIARAYFRAMDSSVATDTGTRAETGDAVPERSGDAPPAPESDAVVQILRDAGILTPEPRALLGAAHPQGARLSLLQAYAACHPVSGADLAFLVNVIIAGCSIQGRPFTPREASEGAAATCNLGLENWPPRWGDADLVAAFQVGWAILHRDVCMYCAGQLIDVLVGIRCRDRDIQLRLDGLRRELVRAVGDREPWRARTALDVIIMLDAPCWAALLTLLDEYPVMHAALASSRQGCRRINPTDFEFISENSQIARVRDFMASVPAALTR